MSIARIGEVQAKKGLEEELREFLLSILPTIKSSEGCQSVRIYRHQEEPAKFMMIEIWDRLESHQASLKKIPQEKFGEIGRLLASPASGGYYELVAEK